MSLDSLLNDMKAKEEKLKDHKAVKAAAVEAAEAASYAKAIGSVGGCGRVYVDIGKVRANSKVKSVVESAGLRMTKRPGCTGLMIYVGYDNATGLEWDKGEKIAEVFRNHGFRGGVDGDGD